MAFGDVIFIWPEKDWNGSIIIFYELSNDTRRFSLRGSEPELEQDVQCSPLPSTAGRGNPELSVASAAELARKLACCGLWGMSGIANWVVIAADKSGYHW